MDSLLDIFSEHSPRLLSSGQIRMECPFRENHEDGSGKQSFFISPDINAVHCFSCGYKGSLVRLLTTKFDIGYFKAVEYVNLSDFVREKKEFELDIVWKQKPPRPFLKRGFTKDTLKHFQLGVTDDGWMIIPFYDNFENPKKLVGYQKRKDKPERVVINSTGFDKRHYLYNLDTSYDYVVLVEGYSDVFRLYQHGYNSCSTLGTSLSDEQVELLQSFDTVYLARDNDLPGREATERDNHLLSKHVNIKVIPYTHKDPGACLSPKVWEKAFNSATDYLEYSIAMSMEWDGYLDMRNKVLKNYDKKL